MTYPQDQVVAFVHDHFVPVRIHTDAHPELCAKYHVAWTPTFVVLDADGTEHYRDIGYLPPADFMAQLTLALGHTALEQKDYPTAAKFFQTVIDRYGSSEAAPQALYCLGIAKNRMAGGTADERKAVWKRLMETHPKSDWAKKASSAFD
ncbi:MAG: thioredoxin family protein [Deltaproteobacteria bacterium]|nr:thioredoxin family protein [Deltaproteobacteria bacterium]